MSSSKILFFIFLFAGLVPITSEAATMSVHADKDTYQTGDVINVTISVDTEDAVMNAMQGILTYSQDKLSLLSIKTSKSVVKFWVNEPEVISSGKIQFDGVVMNPPYSGSNGIIFTVQFIADVTGTVPVDVLSASVLADDGKGTDILTQVLGDEFVITKKVEYVPPTPPPTIVQETVPVVEPVTETVEEKQNSGTTTHASTSTSTLVEEIPEIQEELIDNDPILLFAEDDFEDENQYRNVPWVLVFIFVFFIFVFFVIFVLALLSFRRKE